MNKAKLDRHDNDDTEPDRIEAKLLDHRKDDRHGQDDHGEESIRQPSTMYISMISASTP